MLVIELLGGKRMFFVKEPGVPLAEETATKFMTRDIANIIPYNGIDKSAYKQKLNIQ